MCTNTEMSSSAAALSAYAYVGDIDGVRCMLAKCSNKERICAMFWASSAGRVDTFRAILMETQLMESELRMICRAGPYWISEQVFLMADVVAEQTSNV